MNKRDIHTSTEHDDFFKKVELSFKKSKDELWDTLSDRLSDNSQQAKTKVISLTWVKLAAAVALLLVCSTFFLRFYSTTINCPNGQHLSHTLPDGSTVQLNAASSISFHPYWWHFYREVFFEGEGFFSVEKGNRFSVISANGITEVLGTSFNIFSRNKEYKVFCETGRVKVLSTKSNVELIINPGELAILNNHLKQGLVDTILSENVLAWKGNKFIFTSENIQNVINELQRQYNVNIILALDNPTEFVYSGYFTKSNSVETSLNFICKSFNLNFVEINNKEYKVYKKNNAE